MDEAINLGLDKSWGYAPGHGALDFRLGGRFGEDGPVGHLGLDYNHRLSEHWGAFASAGLTYEHVRGEVIGEAMAGLRARW